MPLDLSLPALVNSGGALLFAAIGILAWILGGRTREGRLVASLAIAFGVTYVVENLWPPYDGTLQPTTGSLILFGLLTFFALALSLHFARSLPLQLRRAAILTGVVLLGSLLLYVGYGLRRLGSMERMTGAGPEEARLIAAVLTGAAASTTALSFLACVSALTIHATPREDVSRRRALALQACAYGLFVAFAASFVFPIPIGLNALLLTAVAPIATWALTSRDALGRRVTLALVAAGLAGLAPSLASFVYGLPMGTNFGLPGMLRAVGAFLLAVALLRHGLVGGAAHPRAVRQGPLALGALGALIVTAEIAQNFLAAQYGLLIGGLVAGALLVAARPIERALEGRHTQRAPQPDAAKEDAFRAAVRLALRDRVLTREEELHLHRVAQHMGIPTGRAHELLVEVEREVNAR